MKGYSAITLAAQELEANKTLKILLRRMFFFKKDVQRTRSICLKNVIINKVKICRI